MLVTLHRRLQLATGLRWFSKQTTGDGDSDFGLIFAINLASLGGHGKPGAHRWTFEDRIQPTAPSDCGNWYHSFGDTWQVCEEATASCVQGITRILAFTFAEPVEAEWGLSS